MGMVFESFSPKLQKLLKEKSLLEPTLPQKLGIPVIQRGENALIIASTGHGKTESAMLPLLDKISAEQSKQIAMLYITPLRALNRDLLDRLVWWADKLDIEIAVRHGDTSQHERAVQRVMPAHILITTPETLQAILPGKKMQEHLRNVKHVVIDEIHELVESKRGIQLSLALERLREIAGDFQRIALSATVGSPQKVADFLGENVRIIRAEHEKKYDIRVACPKAGEKERAAADDLAIGEETAARLLYIAELIRSHKSVLAFTNTRETAEVISSRLRKLDKNMLQDVHHGSLSKERRIKSERMFKNMELRSLIATSSLELGIDIGSIDLVIQYLSPRQVTRLIQRVGRSGHRVGEVSRGIILSGGEDIFESAVIARNAARKNLEEIKMHEYATDVLASQIIGLTMDRYEIDEESIWRIVKRSYPFRDIGKGDISGLVKFLESLRTVWLDNSPNPVVRRRKRSFQYYFENLSMIPDTRQYKVISVIEHEPIGVLDEGFVAEHGQPGERFIFSGRAWRIVQVDNRKVMVEPIEDIESAIPAWEGELIPVPYAIAQQVGELRRLISVNMNRESLVSEIGGKYGADAASAMEMVDIIRKHKPFPVPDDRNFLIETHRDFVIIHSCCGSLVNDTIARYLSALITEKSGVSASMKTDPYRIMLQTVYKAEEIKNMLESYGGDLSEVLAESLRRSSVFKWRFLHVARRFGIISRGADFGKINLGKIVSQYENTLPFAETLREILLEKADVRKADEVLGKIARGEIRLWLQPGLSFLGELGLTQQFAEVMKPLMPEKEIFLAFKRRLMNTRMRLLCVNCGGYNLVKAVKDVDEQPECPKCGSRLIAAVRKGHVNAAGITKKKLKKKELSQEEMKEFQGIRRSSDLVIVYGRKAMVALAGRGIGPQTAARLLANLQPTKEKFLRDILEAEKQFVKTKKYWK